MVGRSTGKTLPRSAWSSLPVDCQAPDDVCFLGKNANYQMYAVTTAGANKPLSKELIFTPEGVVGSGGKLDGTFCLTRTATGLTLADRGAFSVLAWVKSTRNKAPWESAIFGSPGHYFIALDTNPASERFLAALATTQSTPFDYRSATATKQVPAGSWHHVAQTYDTTAAKMLQYVDGKQVNAVSLSGNVASGVGAVLLGCRKDAAYGQFFIGNLDEVAVYTRAVTAVEIADYVRRTAP